MRSKIYITNWLLHKVHTRKKEKLNAEVITIPLVLDGGNIIKAIDNLASRQ